MYQDPSGNFIDVVLDVGFIAYDIYKIYKDPNSGGNWAALAADVLCAVIPGLTGGGALVRAFERADDLADITKIIEKAIKSSDAKAIKRTSNTSKWGMWDDVAKSTYNGRYYTREAIDRMTPKGYGTAAGGYQARGIPTSVVEDVIANGTFREVVRNGVTRTIFESNGVRVVTEQAGKIVITTMKY